MAVITKLRKHVRRAIQDVISATDRAESKALLGAADIALNTLELQESPGFYLDYLRSGHRLLVEGHELAGKVGSSIGAAPPADKIPEDAKGQDFDDAIVALNKLLVRVVSSIEENRSVAEKDYLVRLTQWETGLYAHNLKPSPSFAQASSTTFTPETLRVYLLRRFPQWKELQILRLVPLEGGFSKKTFLFETEDSLNGRQSLVIRAEQTVDLQCYEGCKVAKEFYMIQLMRKAGLPIAEPLWLETDESQFGMQFIVSRRAEGRTYGGALGSSEQLSESQLRSIIDVFIQMHNIRIDPEDPLAQQSHIKEWLPCKTVRATTQYYLSTFVPRVMQLAKIASSPQLVRGLRWLESNIPHTDETPVVVHVDFAFNNLILNDKGVCAVLDWEASHLGDPAEDIVWTQLNLAAYISMTDFLKLYNEGTGRNISEYRLAYFRVAKCAADAINCLSAMSALDREDAAGIKLALLAYKYLAIFGNQFNELIAKAESVRDVA